MPMATARSRTIPRCNTKTTDFYSPAHDRGIAWHDPVLMIIWPVTAETAIVSDRDRALPRLAE
jgi:dTDP-4-dehydrorhamnose 3,5-epimerase